MVIALVAVPAGVGAKPDKIYGTATEPFVVPAGLGCAFDFLVAPDGFRKEKTFSDGTNVRQAQATVTMTNLEGPGSYIQYSDYKATDTFLDANTAQSVIIGKVWVQFYPGDQGPLGVVGANGGAYAFDGQVSLTLDLNTFLYTSISYKGPVVDLCAELAD